MHKLPVKMSVDIKTVLSDGSFPSYSNYKPNMAAFIHHFLILYEWKIVQTANIGLVDYDLEKYILK